MTDEYRKQAAWDETWGPGSHDGECAEDVWLVTSAEPYVIFRGAERARYVTPADRHARACLAGAAPDLYRALKALEWSRRPGHGERQEYGPRCPVCHSQRDKDPYLDHGDYPGDQGRHKPDCSLAAVLRKARGE